MTDEEKLQKYLPLIRNAAGWTAEELGNKIGVTKQTISNLENQKTKMSKTQYLAIQMVISQKIATTPNDMTLANVMRFAMYSDEDNVINFEAVPDAIETVENFYTEEKIYAYKSIVNTSSLKSEGGLSKAIDMLGLKPAKAISAAILGATIAPWLTKALGEDKKDKK